MVIFSSESDLLAQLDQHDDIVRQCVSGDITFAQFCDQYKNFYSFYALDGHESDEEELFLLEKHAARIRPHEVIAIDILAGVCSDEDAQREVYVKAGRFGSLEAVRRLALIELPKSSR